MSRIRDSADPAFLIGVFRTGNETACSAAADRLVNMPSSKYTHLLEGLQDKNENVRRWSAISLGRMQEAFFVPQIAGLLKDDAEAVREVAFAVLTDLVGADQLLGHISAEMSRTNSAEGRRQLDSYLARVRADYRGLNAGLDESELASLRNDPRAIILTTRREPGRNRAPFPPEARRARTN